MKNEIILVYVEYVVIYNNLLLFSFVMEISFNESLCTLTVKVNFSIGIA